MRESVKQRAKHLDVAGKIPNAETACETNLQTGLPVKSGLTAKLCEEITSAFPPIEMPARESLLLNDADRERYSHVVEDLENVRSSAIDGDTIRAIHQELYVLSPVTFRWLLPHYLLFCLTEEAQYNRFETEFLIYNLGPELRFQSATAFRLSLFNAEQILCLIHFLEWCQLDEYWQETYEMHIARAISFLRTLEPKQ